MKEQIATLFEKYINKTINEDELFRLYSFFQSGENQEQLKALLEKYFDADTSLFQGLHERSEVVENLAWDGIRHQIKLKGPSVVNKQLWFPKFAAVAAAVLLVLSISFYFIQKPGTSLKFGTHNYGRHDIQPGTNRATLVSSKGTVYQLSGAQEEIITDKKNIRYKDGTVVADDEPNQNLSLSTPRGGQYRVTLSDGTRVWLNAASSLSYPANFIGKERRVELTGEGYFEVAHNPEKPFIVSTYEQQIKVLGTSFNVNAYKEEHKTVTTLLNGRVQLSKSGSSTLEYLNPGEQSTLDQNGFGLVKVDAHLFSAWKDGEFRFKATSLVEALRQVERWYDLDIDYTGIPTDIQIHASISRNKALSTVLHALERISDLKFEVKGRRLKLMK